MQRIRYRFLVYLPKDLKPHRLHTKTVRSRGYKTFFILISVKHEILNAHNMKISSNSACLGSDEPSMLFFLLLNVKMATILGILTFMSRKNVILS